MLKKQDVPEKLRRKLQDRLQEKLRRNLRGKTPRNLGGDFGRNSMGSLAKSLTNLRRNRQMSLLRSDLLMFGGIVTDGWISGRSTLPILSFCQP